MRWSRQPQRLRHHSQLLPFPVAGLLCPTLARLADLACSPAWPLPCPGLLPCRASSAWPTTWQTPNWTTQRPKRALMRQLRPRWRGAGSRMTSRGLPPPPVSSAANCRCHLPPCSFLLVSALLPVSARLFACSPPCLCVALHRCCWFGTRRRLGNPACWPAAQRLCLACCLSCLPALNSPRPPRCCCCCCCCRRCCPRRHTRHPWRHKRQRPPRRALWPGRAGLQGGRPGHCEGVL
jgi:hypothetical protein